ncbi:MAG TPA: hypothetical protein VF476_10050 [Chitinophagaceae bacterium]
MPRINILVCSGVLLLNATALTAQVLPRNPTAKQVVSYQLWQQQQWALKQLPQNSVLYQFNAPKISRSIRFTYQEPSQNSFRFINVYAESNEPNSFLAAQIRRSAEVYSQTIRNSWWRNPLQAPGAELLRSFILRNEPAIRR